MVINKKFKTINNIIDYFYAGFIKIINMLIISFLLLFNIR